MGKNNRRGKQVLSLDGGVEWPDWVNGRPTRESIMRVVPDSCDKCPGQCNSELCAKIMNGSKSTRYFSNRCPYSRLEL